ncbi:MAG TPA: single-stranded DNA-binding protein [Actinoplanes sp.]|nr:single-stranded DNA-binding protein [Actinoplanes sp.]
MFETSLVVVGNVLTAPEWRRAGVNETLVASFRLASTARRFDREAGRWVDGDSLRLRVNCWRKLAENVCASVNVGDPVVVTGRVFSRDWTDADGNGHLSYEMEAVAIGHDLARGKARFFRNRPTALDATEGPEADGVVRGEAATPVPEDEVPIRYGEGIPDADEPMFDPSVGERPASPNPSAAGTPSATGVPGGLDPDLDVKVEELGEEPAPRRARRATRRQPVPA